MFSPLFPVLKSPCRRRQKSPYRSHPRPAPTHCLFPLRRLSPQLEILPADTTSAATTDDLRALVGQGRRQVSPLPAAAAPAAPSGTSPVPKSGQDNGNGVSTARALAGLPKGMRFGSPNPADKSRAANKRRLAANARAVANDRWAAQLGYQDGQEHIRDLK